MALGQATTKTMDVAYFWLESPRDLVDCLEAVATIGCSGQITQSISTVIDDEGVSQLSIRWGLVITGSVLPPGMTALEAAIDDVLIWDLVALRRSDRATFEAQYTIKP